MADHEQFGKQILDDSKSLVEQRTNEIVANVINQTFDHVLSKMGDFPEKIVDMIIRLKNDAKTKEEITSRCSELMAKEGIIPKSDQGLPDKLLVSNLHQDGYLSGLYMGYILTMMAMIDYDAPQEMVMSIRKSVVPELIGKLYDERERIEQASKDEKYSLIHGTKNENL